MRPKGFQCWPSQRAWVKGFSSSKRELSKVGGAKSPLWILRDMEEELSSSPPFIASSAIPGFWRRLSLWHCLLLPLPSQLLAAAQETVQVSMPKLHIPKHLMASKILCLGLIPSFSMGNRIISSPLYRLLSPQHPCGCIKRQCAHVPLGLRILPGLKLC